MLRKNKEEVFKTNKGFSRYDQLPNAVTDGNLIPGCLILEGGGWRGLYTQGVLDAMMEEDINIQTVIGVSAGSMSSLSYASGQIGMSARINLKYRLDSRYCGIRSLREEHGMTGFTYFFRKIVPENGFNWNRISPNRRLVAVASNCITGRPEYFEYGQCNFEKAVAASATVPYVSKPVVIEGVPYLDGGCTERIPYQWALKEGYQKIVIVRTRHRGYSKKENDGNIMNTFFYHAWPNLKKALDGSSKEYMNCIRQITLDEAEGKIFVQAPKEPVEVSRFEKDLEKLGRLYETGYREMKERMAELKQYLGAYIR